MQVTNAEGAVQELTSTVVDANQKPYLRGTLSGALTNMGYAHDEIEDALNKFFDGRTLQ